MSGRQQAVLWIGLILIAFKFFTAGQWQSIWSAISTVPGGGSILPKSGSGNGSGQQWWNPTGPFSAAPGGSIPGVLQSAAPGTIPAPGVTKV